MTSQTLIPPAHAHAAHTHTHTHTHTSAHVHRSLRPRAAILWERHNQASCAGYKNYPWNYDLALKECDEDGPDCSGVWLQNYNKGPYSLCRPKTIGRSSKFKDSVVTSSWHNGQGGCTAQQSNIMPPNHVKTQNCFYPKNYITLTHSLSHSLTHSLTHSIYHTHIHTLLSLSLSLTHTHTHTHTFRPALASTLLFAHTLTPPRAYLLRCDTEKIFQTCGKPRAKTTFKPGYSSTSFCSDCARECFQRGSISPVMSRSVGPCLTSPHLASPRLTSPHLTYLYSPNMWERAQELRSC